MVKSQAVTCALALLIVDLAAADSPTIRGRLLSEDGMPVAGSVSFTGPVPCNRTPSGGLECRPGPYYSVKTDAEGRFETGAVVPTSYIVFASAPGFLDSGTWPVPDQRRTVDVGDGKSINNFVSRLRHAAEVEVRVNDPLGLYFVPCGSPVSCSNLIIGVTFGTGAFLGAIRGERDADGGSVYRVAVPRDQPFGLWVWTQTYAMVDESGNPVKAGVNADFTVPQGTCKKRFVFTITGLQGQ